MVVLAEIKLPKGVAKGTYPVTASLRYQACNDSQCLPPVTSKAEIRVKVEPGGKPQQSDLFSHAAAAAVAPATPDPPSPTADSAPAAPAASLGLTLLLALFGGLVLNAMPCVLPVLSLKLFGLVRSAGHGRAEVVRGTLATAAGILVSFLAMAAAAVAFRAAGTAVGWGVQFQHPGFVAFLAVLVVLFCLNLWGLFEIQLPYRLAQLGGAGAREGIAGHFFSGLFATLMATPCSAPFLGSAVGFALAQTAPVIFAVFLALGLGMALPYLLVAAVPGVARLLPRPGAWMETVRGAMGFLLAGSAVWLFYVLSSQVAPEQLAAIQLGLLGIALFVWLRHRSVGSTGGGRTLRGGAAAGVVAAIAVTLFAATGNAGPRAATQYASTASPAAGLIPWVTFDRARAESLRPRRPAGLRGRHRQLVLHLQGQRAAGARHSRGGARLPGARRGPDAGRLDEPRQHDRRLPRRARPLRHPVLSPLPAGEEPARVQRAADAGRAGRHRARGGGRRQRQPYGGAGGNAGGGRRRLLSRSS